MLKLKQNITLLISLLLLVSNFSFAINVHYCGDELASVSIQANENNHNKNCCGEQEESDDSCCKDKKIKLEKKHTDTILKSIDFSLPLFYIPVNHYSIFPSYHSFSTIKKQLLHYYCDSNAPPFYKLYHQLIFYA